MQWKHTCSIDWLAARRECLTATDVKELLPVTKTGRPRKVDEETYFKIMAKKLAAVHSDDCVSTGAAARGHFLEPYAIEFYNKHTPGRKSKLAHWDDIVLTRPTHTRFDLGFSPDALDVALSSSHPVSIMVRPTGVHEVGEVKSYYPERHLICGHTPKDMLDERWQLAVAMAVCDEVDEGHLLFFNPSMKDEMFLFDYDRSELADEIATVLQVEADWIEWVRDFMLSDMPTGIAIQGTQMHEKAIIESIEHAMELNPRL